MFTWRHTGNEKMKNSTLILLGALAVAGTHARSETINRIDAISATNDRDTLILQMTGRFDQRNHAEFFINTDFNPSTGVSEGKIHGADYLTIDDTLYRIHGNDAEDRDYLGTISIEKSANRIIAAIPIRLIPDMEDRVSFASAIMDGDWGGWTVQGTTKYSFFNEHDDSKYLFGDNAITIAIDKRNADHHSVAVYRNSDQRILANSDASSAFYRGLSDSIGSIKYHIEKQTGGFDVVYAISLKQDVPAGDTEHLSPMVTLMIPDLRFQSRDTLSILNPLFKHHLWRRSLGKEKGYYYDGWQAHRTRNFFAVANLIRHTRDRVKETHQPYGDQFVYSPVIVATDPGHSDGGVAIGSSLNANFIDDRLAALMKIEYGWDNYWNYIYELTPLKDLGKGDILNVRIPVRFAARKNWIFTLYPYKRFLAENYHRDRKWAIHHPKDTRPIQAIVFSYPESYRDDHGHYRHTRDERQWAYQLIGDQQDETIPLSDVLHQFGDALLKKHYERAMIWNFTGTYYQHDDSSDDPNECLNSNHYSCMADQLPFQFLDDPRKDGNILPDRFAEEMMQLIDSGNLAGFEAEIGYDWGISGNIPVDGSGEPLSQGEWEPDHLVPFDYLDGNSNSHVAYAEAILSRVSSLSDTPFAPRFIRLDAFSRMEVTNRLAWLRRLKTMLPETTFATESSIDYMHCKASMINQLDSTEPEDNIGFIQDHELTSPDYLATYMNPGMDIVVNLDSMFLKRSNGRKKCHLKHLVRWGYTPLVKEKDAPSLGAIGESFINVGGLNNAATDHCFDGVQSNEEWPYGECLDQWNNR